MTFDPYMVDSAAHPYMEDRVRFGHCGAKMPPIDDSDFQLCGKTPAEHGVASQPVEPTDELKQALWDRCRRFVVEQRIRAAESVYQQDNVIENAYDLLGDICAVVGYYSEDAE